MESFDHHIPMHHAAGMQEMMRGMDEDDQMMNNLNSVLLNVDLILQGLAVNLLLRIFQLNRNKKIVELNWNNTYT